MPAKGSIAIQERRRKVWELLLYGFAPNSIAKALGCSYGTVLNDIKEIRAKNKNYIERVDISEEIGDAVAKFDEIFASALREYNAAEKSSQKSGFLSTAMAALEKKERFLVEVGVLPKQVATQEPEQIVAGINIKRASLEEVRSLRDRVRDRLQQADTPIVPPGGSDS